MRRLVVLAFVMIGCAHHAVRLVDGEAAHREGRVIRRVSVEVAATASDEAALHALIAAADREGATMVSDVKIIRMRRVAGVMSSCETSLLPAARTEHVTYTSAAPEAAPWTESRLVAGMHPVEGACQPLDGGLGSESPAASATVTGTIFRDR
jgi:hypothetical protein